jgi:hypothetical protein
MTQLSHGSAHVLGKLLAPSRHGESPRASRGAMLDVTSKRLRVAKPAQSLGFGGRFAHPSGAELVGTHGEVRRNLIVHIVKQPIPSRWKAEELPDSARNLECESRHWGHVLRRTLLTAPT